MKLNGLVLAGGLSQRMGKDKACLVYRDKPQYLAAYEMLNTYCENTYISCRDVQDFDLEMIKDLKTYGEIGPAAGLAAAFEKTDGPWMVLAVDYPLIEKEDLEKLIHERDTEKFATVYLNEKAYFEPGIGIYEASFAEILFSSLEEGKSSLQEMLRQNDVKSVNAENEAKIKSVDTEEEYQKIKNLFK